jgi:hypothetical protein
METHLLRLPGEVKVIFFMAIPLKVADSQEK